MTKKLVLGLGLGIASGALLTAWLMTGERGQKTKNYIVRRARNLKDTIKINDEKAPEDSEIHYV